MISEHEIKKALRRREPPQRFTERTLARIGRSSTPAEDVDIRHPSRVTPWITVAAAATLVVAIAFAQLRSYHRQSQARAITRDVSLALRIAGEKLHDAQVKMSAIGQRGEKRQ